MDYLYVILGLITALLAILFTYVKWAHQYWQRMNLDSIEPIFFFGNMENPFNRNKRVDALFEDYYKEFKKRGLKHGGIYFLTSPTYMAVDLDYIKNVMTKDFTHFTDRGLYYNEKADPLTAHLFTLGGTKWRNLRVKLSPTFTSGKMKKMFGTLAECGKLLIESTDAKVDKGEPIDIKDTVGRFATDVIGSCAFGLDCNSIKDADSPFRKNTSSILNRSKFDNLKFAFGLSFPKLAQAINMKILPKHVSDFFMSVVRDTVGYREKNDIVRPDFLQILIDLKNNKLDDEITEQHDGRSLTIEEVAAQCFVFFFAGFETSSTTITFTMLELCRRQDLQEKVRKEIFQVMKRHQNEITYDGLIEMKYLEQVINETLRIHPAVPFVTRKCVKDYQVPDTDVVIEKGVRCLIPISAIHHDEEIYPEPEVFDPERFSEENVANRHSYTHLPFGEGPRACIGMRFGLMQTKIGLALLLKNYRFTLDAKTKQPLEYSVDSVLPLVKGGIWLKAERL